jgi:hypothetical protein
MAPGPGKGGTGVLSVEGIGNKDHQAHNIEGLHYFVYAPKI